MEEIKQLSIKKRNGIEQHITQLLKLMRSAKLSKLQLYNDLQAMEELLCTIRQEEFDDDNTEYQGY